MEQESTELSIRSCCKLLSVNRSGLYYAAVPDKNNNLSTLILEIWLLQNTKGYRTITEDLKVGYKTPDKYYLASRDKYENDEFILYVNCEILR